MAEQWPGGIDGGAGVSFEAEQDADPFADICPDVNVIPQGGSDSDEYSPEPEKADEAKRGPAVVVVDDLEPRDGTLVGGGSGSAVPSGGGGAAPLEPFALGG